MRLIPVLLCLLLVVPAAHSLGVSPPSAKITFSPGATGEFDVLLLNSRHHAVETEVEIKGEYKDYFSATNPSISSRGSAAATVSFELPDEIEPGSHKTRIVWTENFFDPDSGALAAKTAITLIIEIWKPYPGRYAKLHTKPRHVPEGQDTDIEYTITSRGTEAVTGDVRFSLYAGDGTLIDTLYDRDITVEGDSDRKRYVQVRSRTYDPGRYDVEASYDYGAGLAEHESTLIIGTKDVEIDGVTREFNLNEPVNRFNINLSSLWNNPIPDVSAQLQLGRQTGRTPTITLAPFEEKTFTGYWETDEQLEVGSHNGLVTVFFDGEEHSQPVTIVLVNETEQIEAQLEQPEQVVLIGAADLIFFIVLIAILSLFYVVTTRRHRGKE